MGATKLMTAAGGGITLDAASTASDKTITVPADNGTLVYANSSGNVGIGTSSPSARVDVSGSGSNAVALIQATRSDLSITTAMGSDGGLSGGFVRTTTNHPLVLGTNNTERARIDSSGNLSSYGNTLTIAPSTATNAASLVNTNTGGNFFFSIDSSTGGTFGNGAYVRNIYSSGSYRIYVTASSAGVYLAPAGTSWTSASDERFKTDLTPIENGLDKVCTLRSVTGRYVTDEEGTSRSFLIAQDVQAVLPEAVDASDPEKLGVQYTDTIPLLVAAIKELNAKVEAQAAQIALQSSEIAALKGQA